MKRNNTKIYKTSIYGKEKKEGGRCGWNVGVIIMENSAFINCYEPICYVIGWNGWDRNYSKIHLSSIIVL